MNYKLKKYFNNNLIFTAEKECALNFKEMYFYYLCYGDDKQVAYKEFKEALQEYVESNPLGIIGECYFTDENCTKPLLFKEMIKFCKENLLLSPCDCREVYDEEFYYIYSQEMNQQGKMYIDEKEFLNLLNVYKKEILHYNEDTSNFYLTVDSSIHNKYYGLDKKDIKDDLLKDNDHTFTIETGVKNKEGSKCRVCIFSTMGKKYDMDKIKAHKDKKENVEVVHCCISSEAMKILSDFVKIHEEAYDEKASLLEEYHKEYDNE